MRQLVRMCLLGGTEAQENHIGLDRDAAYSARESPTLTNVARQSEARCSEILSSDTVEHLSHHLASSLFIRHWYK